MLVKHGSRFIKSYNQLFNVLFANVELQLPLMDLKMIKLISVAWITVRYLGAWTSVKQKTPPTPPTPPISPTSDSDPAVSLEEEIID